MKKTRKIALLALLSLLSAQFNAAFPISSMAGAEHHAILAAHDQQAGEQQDPVHQHGHASLQSVPQSADCLDSSTSSEHHQAMDCEDNCMDCVNHCSSIGIQAKACNLVDYAHRTAGTTDRDAFFRIENPFRPPILS